MKKLKGILKFETELDWSKDVLDKSFNTVITDIPCTLFFPKLMNYGLKIKITI